MKKFEKLTSPKELDFFEICTINGEKYIHLFGYTYQSDIDWRNIECTGLLIPIAEFVRDYKENEEYINELYQSCTQYEGEYSSQEILDIINSYYNGNPPQFYLGFADITEDTPCGDYVI